VASRPATAKLPKSKLSTLRNVLRSFAEDPPRGSQTYLEVRFSRKGLSKEKREKARMEKRKMKRITKNRSDRGN